MRSNCAEGALHQYQSRKWDPHRAPTVADRREAVTIEVVKGKEEETQTIQMPACGKMGQNFKPDVVIEKDDED